jgi:hypothetical protein
MSRLTARDAPIADPHAAQETTRSRGFPTRHWGVREVIASLSAMSGPCAVADLAESLGAFGSRGYDLT